MFELSNEEIGIMVEVAGYSFFFLLFMWGVDLIHIPFRFERRHWLLRLKSFELKERHSFFKWTECVYQHRHSGETRVVEIETHSLPAWVKTRAPEREKSPPEGAYRYYL